MDDDSKEQAKGEWVNIVDPFAKRLIESYLQRRESDIELLRSALTENDFDTIRVKGHNLSGSGTAYGLNRISEFGQQLEEAALKKDQVVAADQIALLEDYIHNLRIT